MGWRGVSVAIAMAAMFLTMSLAPMASFGANAELTAEPTPGVIVNLASRDGDQVDSNVFSTGDGNVYVVWVEQNSQISTVFFSMSSNGGSSFSEPDRVMDIGVRCQANDPVVVANADGSKVYVAWSDNRTGTYQIYMSTFSGGPFFSSNVLVAPSSEWWNQTNPDLAIENDVLYLTYAEDVPGNNNTFVMFATFTNAIVPDIMPKRMPGTPVKDIQQYPSISVREKNVTIAWHDLRSNALGDIYVTTSHNYGMLFADAVKVSGPEPTKHWYPSVNNLPSGKIFVVWQEERGGSYDIIGSVSTADDSTFSTPFVIDDSAGEQSMPSSSADSRGVVSVVYRKYITDGFQVMYTRSNDAVTFRTPIQADPFASNQSSPNIFCDFNGTAYIVFQDDRGPPSAERDIIFTKVVNEAPTVSIDFPDDGVTRRSLFIVQGSCLDNDTSPVMQVEVKVTKKGGGPVDVEEWNGWKPANVLFQITWDFTINSTAFFDGDYEVHARSFDGVLYSTEKKINVTIVNNNPEPTVDLKITSASITYSPEEPVTDDNVTIYADVHNDGNSDAINVTVDFTIGSNKKSTLIPRVPGYGNYTTLIIWVPTFPISYTIKVEVDPDNYVEELNEANNMATKEVVVSEPVLRRDLAITQENITYSPSPAHQGELINISAKISNLGEYIYDDVQVIFLIDSSQQVVRYTGRIDGPFYTVYANWTPASVGPHSVEVLVNADGDMDTSNDRAEVGIEVFAESYRADLAVGASSVIISPAVPKVGQNVTIAVLVQNLGEIPASQVTVAFRIDGLLQSVNIIPFIDAGMANETSIIWKATLGQRTVNVTVDGLNTVVETDESNNNITKVFTVFPEQTVKSNLYVDDDNISYNPDPPVKEQVLKVTVTVYNLGNDTAANIEVQMKLDGTQLDGLQTIGYLAPGEHTSLTWNWMPTAGEHTFEVIVDPSNDTGEWNESDNTAQISVDIPADPISSDVWLPILAVVSIGVLGVGIYMFWKSRQKKKGKV